MTTTPITLPELSDDAVDRIEEAVFTQIAEERAKQDGQATTGDSFTSEARATPSPSATAN